MCLSSSPIGSKRQLNSCDISDIWCVCVSQIFITERTHAVNCEIILNLLTIPFSVSVTEQMLVTRKRNETSVIGQIADDLLAWVSNTQDPFKDGNNAIY